MLFRVVEHDIFVDVIFVDVVDLGAEVALDRWDWGLLWPSCDLGLGRVFSGSVSD